MAIRRAIYVWASGTESIMLRINVGQKSMTIKDFPAFSTLMWQVVREFELSSPYIFIYSLFHVPFWQPWAPKSSLDLLKWFVSDLPSEFLSFVKHVIFSALFFEFHFIIFRSIFVVLPFYFCLSIRFSCYFLKILDPLCNSYLKQFLLMWPWHPRKKQQIFGQSFFKWYPDLQYQHFLCFFFL